MQRVHQHLPGRGGFTLHVCRLRGPVWEQRTEFLPHNASCHCLELPRCSVPISSLPRLFWLQSQLAPSPLSPLTQSKQADNEQVSRMSVSHLPHRLALYLKKKKDFLLSKCSKTRLSRVYLLAVVLKLFACFPQLRRNTTLVSQSSCGNGRVTGRFIGQTSHLTRGEKGRGGNSSAAMFLPQSAEGNNNTSMSPHLAVQMSWHIQRVSF